jgi:dTMP kinase
MVLEVPGMGMLVAIEGIDGAGKGTLAANLMALAEAEAIDARSLSFPRYEETRFAKLIGQYLNGRFGALDEVPVHFAALLYAGDRLESRDGLLALLDRHDLVVLDRYVASNAAYNAAKFEPHEQAALIAWIDELEYEIFELPPPRLTCLLSTAPKVADRLVAQKDGRAYTDDTRDLHEADRGYMDRVAQVYERLAAEDRRSTWFRCLAQDEAGALRPPEAIAAEVWARISAELSAER